MTSRKGICVCGKIHSRNAITPCSVAEAAAAAPVVVASVTPPPVAPYRAPLNDDGERETARPSWSYPERGEIG